MKHSYFQNIEECSHLTELEFNDVLTQMPFDSRGLLPVITQDASTKDVLMLAWMNKAALLQTLSTRSVTYWSRSREELWVKGKTSGHTQELVSLSIDCDGDAILCLVNQKGGACHTGRNNCFYLKVDIDRNKIHVVDTA